MTINPHDTRVLLINSLANHPQLQGTSRHITGAYSTQGIGSSGKSQSATEGLAEAQQRLERAIVLDGHLAKAPAELGRVLEKPDQLRAAEHELQLAVHLDSKSSAAFYQLAGPYRRIGEPKRAQEAPTRFKELKARERAGKDFEAIQGFFKRTRSPNQASCRRGEFLACVQPPRNFARNLRYTRMRPGEVDHEGKRPFNSTNGHIYSLVGVDKRTRGRPKSR